MLLNLYFLHAHFIKLNVVVEIMNFSVEISADLFTNVLLSNLIKVRWFQKQFFLSSILPKNEPNIWIVLPLLQRQKFFDQRFWKNWELDNFLLNYLTFSPCVFIAIMYFPNFHPKCLQWFMKIRVWLHFVGVIL